MTLTRADHPIEADSPEATATRLLGVLEAFLAELAPGTRRVVALDSALEKDLALDSLGRMELMLRLERHFEVSLSEQEMTAVETPRELLRVLLQAREGGGPRRSAEAHAREVEAIRPERVDALPNQARTLVEVLEWHADAHGERIHVRLYNENDELEELTYGGMLQGAEEVAAGIRQRGLEAGGPVAIMLPTGHEYFFTFYGVLLAGGVPVPLYPPVRPSQIEDHLRRQVAILRNCRASIMITVPEAKPLARLLKPQVDSLREIVTVEDLRSGGRSPFRSPLTEENIAFLQYTSGSTGQPKGVVLTHANLLANLRSMGSRIPLGSTDVFVSWLPLYHDMGLIGAGMGSLYFASPLVLMSPLAFLARPQRWLWAIHHHGGTLTAGPNFAYELCLNKVSDSDIEGLDLGSMNQMLNGAEPVSPDTIGRFIERYSGYGLKPEAVFPVYGLAENSVGVTFPPIGRPPVVDRIERQRFVRSGRAQPAAEMDARALRYVSCGFPIPGHEVRLVDASGTEVAERQEGRVQFRGPSATRGYYRNPQATRPLFDGDWLNTGDLGYIAEGELYLTGRTKDIVIRAGRNLSPYELEEAVGNLPGVRKGCVVVFGTAGAASSDVAGSGTEKLVVLAETREKSAEALEQLRSRVVAAATDVLGTPPDDVVLAPPGTVLKTSSGKLRRAACQELYAEGRLARRQRGVWQQFLRLGLSGLLPQARRLGRMSALYVYSLYAWCLFVAALPLVWVLLVLVPGTPRRQAMARRITRALSRLGGIPLLVEGLDHLPKGEPCVLVVNHSSYLDAGVLMATLPPGLSFVAKAELGRWFVSRLPLRRLGVRFVERFDRHQSVEDARKLQEEVEKGRSLVLFPEGTFTRMPGLQRFRMGAFTAAVAARVPIVPVVIRGTRSLLRADQWLLRRGPVTVGVYPPRWPAASGPGDSGGSGESSGWTAAVELRDAVRAEMLRRTGEPDLEV